MASDAVKKILTAESTADKLNTDARRKAEDIVSSAKQKAVVAVQKKLAEAKSETEKIRKSDSVKLAEYTKNAEKECAEKLDIIRRQAESNADKAVDAVIDRFFG